MLSFSASTVGCSIGIKEQNNIIYSGFAKSPLELSGAIRIATNKPIQITVGDKVAELDLGGMYAVKGADLKAFIKAIQDAETAKINKR